jgi:hypothetical protein
MAMFSVGNT